MSTTEQMTITMPSDMAAAIKGAVEEGAYASPEEVVGEALRDWQNRRAHQLREFAALKADIDKGFADYEAGRVSDFDPEEIIARDITNTNLV